MIQIFRDRFIALICMVGVLVGVASSGFAQDCDPVLLDQISSSDPQPGMTFGSSVEISGDMALVGVYLETIDGVRTGSVHVFKHDGQGWNFEYRIVPNDGVANGLFGVWFSMDGDSLLIGAADHGVGEDEGAVYAYRLVGGEWVFIQQLTASDGQPMNDFSRVHIEGDTAVVGAPGWRNSLQAGSAYIFEFDGVQWVEVQKISASNGEANDHFGFSPKFLGDRLVVGAAFQTRFFEINGGEVYIFERDESGWTESAILEPESEKDGDAFGFELGLLDDMVIVGDYENEGEGWSGEVVVFEFIDEDWVRTDSLYPSAAVDVEGFGAEIEVEGDVLLVSAPFSNDDSGLVFVYRLIDGVWQESGMIESPDLSPDQLFGIRMRIDAGEAILASPNADSTTGTAYFYTLNCGVCVADLNSDGVLDFEDVSDFLDAFGVGDSAADIDGNGRFDYFDVSGFLRLFAASCP